MGKNSGIQRLSLKQLQDWENLKYGMFIHFGLSTFDGKEFSKGDKPSTLYAPDKLDVEQWIFVACDAGMKYAILTAKHVAGHCLWPTKHTDYHVGASCNTTDVIEAFVNACWKFGIMPGLYYCSWDSHTPLGSLTFSDSAEFVEKNPRSQFSEFTTRAYQEFQSAQIEELLTQYGKIGEVWIDIPVMLPRCYRHELYDSIASLQPDAVIMMNNGVGDGSDYPVAKAWSFDIIAIERVNAIVWGNMNIGKVTNSI